MNYILKISFALILILSTIGCGKVEKKEKESIEKETVIVQMEFGKWKTENDSLGVELKTKQFNKWVDLVERAGKIVCNDSLPKITLITGDEIKTIYFQNPCWEEDSYKIIKQKNVFEIHNDTIFKNRESIFPIDSLESVLRKDIENNGVNPILSENSEKLMFFISYDKKNGFKKLPIILNKLTEKYYVITNKTDIKIWLTDKEYFKPPPRPKK
ncbi:hypothetical protein [Winogradskyella sp. UBA3174]|uniref:hypothetical protein n=1 Tax=Winogradskyella sp. UBA3174 TaxID=1947785 RepID=UPI0025E716BB|nr:hypothetical protein [Winogradskyella sp. UBA3174]|tara:strand:- start:1522 stop:2160 length:639 start_codon:yes stop_codon:yes gene_type:complete